MLYFGAVLELERENLENARNTKRNGTYLRAARDYRALNDVATLMLLQGPRPEEVMSAPVSDVDLENSRWFIAKGKSKAARRWLKLLPESRSIVARRQSNSVWLFPGKKPETHLTDVQHSHENTLVKINQNAREGEPPVRFVLYDFRHTFATRFYEATRDIEALRKVLGHANLRSIQKYVHVSQEHVDSAMKIYETSVQCGRATFGPPPSTGFVESSPSSVRKREVQ